MISRDFDRDLPDFNRVFSRIPWNLGKIWLQTAWPPPRPTHLPGAEYLQTLSWALLSLQGPQFVQFSVVWHTTSACKNHKNKKRNSNQKAPWSVSRKNYHNRSLGDGVCTNGVRNRVRIDDVGSILKFHIGFPFGENSTGFCTSVWLPGSTLNFRIGSVSSIGGLIAATLFAATVPIPRHKEIPFDPWWPSLVKYRWATDPGPRIIFSMNLENPNLLK